MGGPYFNTVYGRGLVEELARIATPPYLVVTMEDLWPLVKDQLSHNLGCLYLSTTLEYKDLLEAEKSIPPVKSVVGIGGGIALDVAKFFTWLRNLPLFQLPTSTSVNAAFAHKSAIRKGGVVQYVGWAVPEAVYVDFDLIQSAPIYINRAGVGDIFCIHTAHYDWKLATERGKEKKWPWDEGLAEEAQGFLQEVRKNTKEVSKMSETGIRLVMKTHRWSGATYHNSGWNPRFIEGSEHFFFYNLEYLTKKKFLHGEPVCLGIILVSTLQDNDPDGITKSIREVGVRVRPEEIAVTKNEVIEAFVTARDFAERENLFYSVLNEKKVDSAFVESVLQKI
ncbi:hypothetical protein HKBW3S42_00947 [Candidatus Hakubella thermalkaliphila]|uniref:3-dehydroquinate synthase n=1 Tax=Candidatus Hakubella thermalkaliphila TaxID=2754717 RepID=A0A6V8PNY2_9ACTN|nr:hypothetical protein HKBW3S42_00947 [Candidatus Hakubella thermalkaliphila]GFP42563.1 hypothetical protein HKBW3C_01687 [Candidatus Hakubella thermalkaliphila]